ncbi:MAG TPA: ABC transporter substrate-binding protein [Burkholderiaceae bacterium]|nr:ABC transporter substrate-binding protein [Burkholderiaceae bacterium]
MARLQALVLAALLGLAAHAEEKTLRWAPRGDAGSMDPHSFNENLTQNITGHVYETLARRARDQRLEPSLAVRWTIVDDRTWRFHLRRGVKFHDGTPFTADDVVFSIERAQQRSSQQAYFARQLGTPVRIDDETVELRLPAPNPILIEHQLNVQIMSHAWCKKHGVERVPDFAAKEEGHSTLNAMGTGPFMLEQREPGTKTVLVRNPNWWGKFEGNVTKAIITPIGSDGTRTAALLAGDIDFTIDAPPQDIARLANEPKMRLHRGLENRVIFFGFDQYRDELLYSNAKGRNPFKDVRVREAFYRAIDVETLKSTIMRGQSAPTGCMAVAKVGCLAPELETRAPADPERARKLLAQAGYPNGFALTLDCPNDRYVNDQPLCLAVAGMLGRIGIKVKVDARPKAIYFQKIDQKDTSFYMLGWGGGTTDAQSLMDPILHSLDEKSQKGTTNHGRYSDPELDRLIDAAGIDMDVERRGTLIAEAQRRAHSRFYYLPIHRQMLTWVSRAGVKPVVMPDNFVRLQWIQID